MLDCFNQKLTNMNGLVHGSWQGSYLLIILNLSAHNLILSLIKDFSKFFLHLLHVHKSSHSETNPVLHSEQMTELI